MANIIRVRDIEVEIVRKNIKHRYLAVLPTEGKVRVSVPRNVPDEVIRALVIKKYDWIKKHIQSFQDQLRQPKREYVAGESHYLRGVRYVMRIEKAKRPRIEIRNKKYIVFFVPEYYTRDQRARYYENWLRKELKKDLSVLVPKWEEITGLRASEVRIKKMKTKWGSCNPEAKRIWINLELIKKPTKYLEYVIVHELLHLVVRTHNAQFRSMLEHFFPKWELYRRELNRFIL